MAFGRHSDPTPAEAAAWNKLTGKYAVRTYRNTAFMDWWQALNDELAARGLPECPFGAARDAWDMGQSPETQANEIAEAFASEPPREPLGHDGGWIDSADMDEDAPDVPSLPDRYR